MTAPRYASVADLKERHSVASDRDDALYARALAAAEGLVDAHTGRRFDLGDTDPRWFRAETPTLCRIADAAGGVATVETTTGGRTGTLTDITSTVVAETVNDTSTVWLIEPDAGPCFPVGRGCWVRVTPTVGWGFQIVPADVTEASLLHAAKLFKRKDSPDGFAGYEGAGVVSLDRRGLDGDAKALLAAWTRTERWAP